MSSQIQVTPAASLSAQDSALQQVPSAIDYPGAALSCSTGLLAQDVVLAASTSNQQLPFPIGLTTAKVIAIYAVGLSDLVVTVGDGSTTTTIEVPKGQPLLLYNKTASQVKLASVLGGKLACVVGG